MSHTVVRIEDHRIELPEAERFEYKSPYRKALNRVHGVSARVVDGSLQSVTLHSRQIKKDGTLGLSPFRDRAWKPYSAELNALLNRHGIQS